MSRLVYSILKNQVNLLKWFALINAENTIFWSILPSLTLHEHPHVGAGHQPWFLYFKRCIDLTAVCIVQFHHIASRFICFRDLCATDLHFPHEIYIIAFVSPIQRIFLNKYPPTTNKLWRWNQDQLSRAEMH